MNIVEDDYKEAIVIDTGSYTVKVGIVGDYLPRAVFPNIVGKPKYELGMKEVYKKQFIGDSALTFRGILKLTYPMIKGIVINWEDMEKVWRHTFYNELKIAPEEHPIFLTEAPLNPKQNRERMVQVMFETFDVPALYISLTAALVLCSTARGAATGVVLDCGDGVSHVLPIYEGHALIHALMRVSIGGETVTNYLQRILHEKGYTLDTSAEREAVREIKENICYVALDYQNELQTAGESSILEKCFSLSDGNIVTLNNERFRAPEVLFQPDLFGIEAPGLHEVVFSSIEKCALDVKSSFISQIIVAGGTTLFEGFKDRLTNELAQLWPNTMVVKVFGLPDRKYSAWIGGSIVASLSTFQSSWLPKEIYEEEGPTIIHDYCF